MQSSMFDTQSSIAGARDATSPQDWVGGGRRVLFCIYSHNIWGGIESWLTGLARFLDAHGWHVLVGLARGTRFNNPEAFRATNPLVATVEFDGRTGTPEGRTRAIVRVLRNFRPNILIPVGMSDAFFAAARA